MTKSLWCHIFVLVTVLAALCSDAEIISKSVCIGDSVQVFQSITPGSLKTKVSLYKSGAGRHELIAMWFLNTSGNYPVIPDNYKSKVSLENGTIILRNFQPKDEATYSVLDGIAGLPEVQILALVPPTNSCELNIRQEENHLIALLNNTDKCGKPVVSVHWMEYPDILYKDKTVIELPPDKEACTYYACIDGEALTCARKSTDRNYCKYFNKISTRGDNNLTASSDKLPSKTYILEIALPVSFVSFIVILIPIILIIRWKKFGIVPKCLGRVCCEAQTVDETFSTESNVPMFNLGQL